MEVGALRSGDPDRLGPYALIGRVGEGGQGTVFLGTGEDGRQVAIKLLHAELTSDEKARARFLRELEVAKQVAPFCTAQVIDADVDGDRPYIVSEYVRGPSLNQQVLEDAPLGGAALDRLAVGTATALSAIHQAKIVHRDFKPHNVLLGPDGPRVIDFGVARAISGGTTLTSRVIGTPSYMSPEQIAGDEVGTPSDVFCWAATLVFAATGRPPFGQDTIPAVINRILHEQPDLGDLHGPLRGLVLDCLEKAPADRPGARQVLMRLLGHEEVSGTETKTPAARAAGGTDETAMLAAGSVRAAEIGDEEEVFEPDPVFGDAPVFDDDDPAFDDYPVFRDPEAPAAAAAFHSAGADGPEGGHGFAGRGGAPDETDATGFEPGLHPTPAAWSADDTLPPDLAGGGEKRGLRGRLADSGRPAVLAGAAALFVAIVVVSSVVALSSGDNGKAGQKVSDPSAPPGSSDVAPSTSAPATTQEPTGQAPVAPSYTPPTDSGSPTGSPSPTGGTTPTDTPTGPTSTPTNGSPSPDDPPTTDPEEPPTDPEEPPTDPEVPPGSGG
ncbi:serine/threonine-protein kinase [Actinomadura sp. 7K507]|uniref:serine/threonine-protein kinase n=1 Tax=Actinomadura sp. 7K507 TaxID=2530365 RepID=UPI001047724B|nr:serine/threonine-protein kinase [Actinomadura sp. 7K507]TDC93288.1 serine/threonine protein kinase [Actinomadura sp. 7K507]